MEAALVPVDMWTYTVDTTCRSFRLGYEGKQTRVRKQKQLIMKIKMVAE